MVNHQYEGNILRSFGPVDQGCQIGGPWAGCVTCKPRQTHLYEGEKMLQYVTWQQRHREFDIHAVVRMNEDWIPKEIY